MRGLGISWGFSKNKREDDGFDGGNVAGHILKSSVAPIALQFKTIELLCKDF